LHHYAKGLILDFNFLGDYRYHRFLFIDENGID